MASERQKKLGEYIGEDPDYLHNPGSYNRDYRVILRSRTAIPFFIEIVDQFNNNVALPWPPLYGADTKEKILGLKLIVNPASISVNMTRMVNRTSSMVGWIEEHWGEEMDTVTFSGSSAAFVSGRLLLRNLHNYIVNLAEDKAQARADFYSYMGFTDDPLVSSESRQSFELNPGLTVKNRRKTLSYEQMREMVKIFVSNGCIFDSQGFVKDRKFIRLSYDYASYLGYFESFDVTEDANTPFRFTYTVTFKSEKTVYRFQTRTAVSRRVDQTGVDMLYPPRTSVRVV